MSDQSSIRKNASFEELKTRWPWKPIRNCPGRFVLSSTHFSGSPKELLGSGTRVLEFRADAAPDPVVVAQLDAGGLISYRRRDGTYIHTLNTTEGFQRKLLDLGIRLQGR